MKTAIQAISIIMLCLIVLAACGRQRDSEVSEIEYDRGTPRPERFARTFDYIGTGQ